MLPVIGTARDRETHVVAVFARERDRVRGAPGARAIGRLDGRDLPSVLFQLQGAAMGALTAGTGTVVFAWLVGRIADDEPPYLFAVGAVAVVVGALLGILLARRSAATFAHDVNAHLERGRIVVLLDARRGEAGRLARKLEAQGALEALPLPVGLSIAGALSGTLLESHPDEGFGATLVAGTVILPRAAARLDAGVRVALVGRDGHAGPVHSSTAGPAFVHAPRPEGGEGWWRSFVPRFGKPVRLRLVDGELVILGEGRRLALLLSGHRNDTVGSALSRLAERFECPDPSARIVIDAIDGGGPGLVILGSVAARRRAVALLAIAAAAVSEGGTLVRLTAKAA
jgi:hypothetical protein